MNPFCFQVQHLGGGHESSLAWCAGCSAGDPGTPVFVGIALQAKLGSQSIAKLVNITLITMVYDTQLFVNPPIARATPRSFSCWQFSSKKTHVGIPSLILAKWRKLFWASKGRDALKPNFNKWPEEPFLPSRNGSSGHLLKFGFKASRPLLAKWRKLHHLCPKKGQLWCLSWWFCLLSGDNSDVFPGGFAFCLGITLIDVAYFGWVGWWMSGDMRELRHLCGHLQPDFGEWVGVAPSMPKKAAWCWEKTWGETSAVPIFHLGSPRKTDPHQVSSFLWQTQEKPATFSGDLVGPVFQGQAKWQIARA